MSPKLIGSLMGRWKLSQRNDRKLDKLDASDIILLRYPKSGVTWLRVMMSRIYTERLGLAIPDLIGSTKFEKSIPAAPRVFVAMDNIGVGRGQMLERFGQRKIVLLLRDPRDIAVSFYFHLTKRSTPMEILAHGVPKDIAKLSLFDFVSNASFGLPKIIDFENYWTAALAGRADTLVLHYEKIRAEPEGFLTQLMSLLQADATAAEIRDAVAFSAFDKMKARETNQPIGVEILKPGDGLDSDSFKTRKGKIGGYRDYFSDQELKAIDVMMAKLSSFSSVA